MLSRKWWRLREDDAADRTAEEETTACFERQLRNRSQSSLCGLPDELLLNIMRYTDGPSLYLLRQVSSVFFRLFNESQFLRYHHDAITRRDMSMRFDRHRLPVFQRQRIARLLHKDQYCFFCWTFRTSDAYPEALNRLRRQVYCSGCQVTHPAILFSPRQRQGPETTRICIGREEKVRLCSHRTLGWSEVDSYLIEIGSGASTAKRPAPRKIKCWHHASGRFSLDAVRSQRPTATFTRALILKETNVTSTWQIPLQRFVPSHTFTRADAREVLSRLGRPSMSEISPCVCPHLPFPDHTLLAVKESHCCSCEDRGSGIRNWLWKKGQQWPFLRWLRIGVCTHEEFTLSCRQCLAIYTVKNQRGQIWLECQRFIAGLSSPAKITWLQNLEPESWGLTADEESKYVSWCDDKRCATRKTWVPFTVALQRCGVGY